MVSPYLKKDWAEFLNIAVPDIERNDMQKHERTGRPLCSSWFLDQLESLLSQPLKPKKPGRKPKKNK